MEKTFTTNEIIMLLSLITYAAYLIYAIFVWVRLHQKRPVAVTIHLMFLCFLLGVFVSVSVINLNILPLLVSFACMVVFCKFNILKDAGLKQPFPAGVLFLVYGISHGMNGILIAYFVIFAAFVCSLITKGVEIDKALYKMKKTQLYPFVALAFIGSLCVLGCMLG